MAVRTTLEVIPTGSAVGAEIRGVDLRSIDATTFDAIHRAWLEHQVLLFREQGLSDQDLIGFSRRFGTLDQAPIQENGRRFVDGLPEIYVVSNVVENGIAIGSLGAGEAVWHTDMSYLEDPPKASILYALQVPPKGGDTSFCTMYGAWESLPDDLREIALRLRVKHDGTYNSGGYLRAGVEASDDPRTAAGTLHPLVCTHPETGRRHLYLGRRRNAWLEGMPLDESNALLDRIWSIATADALAWSHQWRPSDLVLWDNRCVMHRRDAFDPGTRRVMHRTQIKGEAQPKAAIG
jgi:taurine dioxygenase